MAEPTVRAEGLTKFYGRRRGVVGLDFEVQEGEAFGFLGAEGAGKTTLIRMLLNLVFPTYGTAEIFGLDCVRDASELKEYVGYVPAEAGCHRGMRAKELLQWSAALYRLPDLERAWTLAERLDLDVDRRLDDPSWDGAKKAAVVQALLHEPGLLLLDEPFAGLDLPARTALAAILSEENAKGVTILMASGSLAEVRDLCRRTAIVREGRIAAVEGAAALRGRELRRVTLETERDLGAADFPSGRADGFRREGRAVSFLYAGDGNGLVRELAVRDSRGLLVGEPSLEEFLGVFYPREARS